LVLLAVYPVVFWALALRWRRRLLGFAVVFCGTVFLAGVCAFHAAMPRLLPGSVEYIQIAQSVLWPYSVLVPIVALYCACLPRRAPTDCVRCGYRMHGLEDETDTCPECGKLQPWALSIRYRPSGTERPCLHHSDAPTVVPRTISSTPPVPSAPPPVRAWRAAPAVPGFSGLARPTKLRGQDPGRPVSPRQHPVDPAEHQHPERQPAEQHPTHR